MDLRLPEIRRRWDAECSTARLAIGHDSSLRRVENWDLPTLAGAGALRSTAHDLLNFLAANLGNVLRERVARISLGSLEHQVLKEMRKAGPACGLVGATDLVPDHMGDNGRAMIGDHHDLEPVGEGEISNVRLGPGRRARDQSRCERKQRQLRPRHF